MLPALPEIILVLIFGHELEKLFTRQQMVWCAKQDGITDTAAQS
jgi:hypothetical protein